MGSGVVLPDRDPPDRTEIVRESELSRVTRLFLPGRTVIRKEPLGPEAERRLRHELALLERLRGVERVAQLVEAPQYPGSIMLADAGDASLAELAKPLAIDELIGLAVELAGAVARIHREGVMHRDICPENIVISHDGSPCLVGFGLATSFAEIRPEFTHHTQIVGTLAYLAPEQTGRTGRAVDQRADLYALGATLYELATGSPPFGTGDPLRLTHDHLARIPAPPAQVNPAAPEPLSAIIVHLLEKEPDHRYQTAEGVLYDLQRLRNAPAGALRVGEHDVPLRLRTARLVGRDDEVAALATAFEDALAGRCRGLLVGGGPGVGKTALVDELRPLVTGGDGWFVVGKFDQYRRDLEFDAVNQAFRALGRLLLAEPDDELTDVRGRIVAAVGANAGLLTATVPEFEALLGVPPAPGDPLTAQMRLQSAGVAVLRAVASRKRPVALFIDDMQWAGRTPLGFVDLVLGAEPIEGLLVVGAYRETELNAAHPLAAPLSRWRNETDVRYLRLDNLPVRSLATMVAEMLHVDASAAASLVEVIEPHTSGNPYETVELLNALRGVGVLAATAAGWRWDPAAVRAHLGHSEVAGMLAARIEAMPTNSRQTVEAMACLGGRAELSLLQTATGAPAEAVEQDLGPALDEGVLVVEPGAHEAVRFRHDRIREVILGGLDPPRRRDLQLAMARRLAGVPELYAVAAGQYMPVIDAVDDAAERCAVVGLVRRAADQARLIGDHALVNALLTAALRLIDPAETATLVEVRTGRHAALYSMGRLEDADEEFRTIEELHPTALGRSNPTAVQVSSLTHRNRFPEAVALGIDSLRELGIAVPAAGRLPLELDHQFEHLYQWLDHTDATDDLARLDITDPTLLAATHLINAIVPAAYYADLSMYAWLSLEALRILLEHGPGPTLVGPASEAAFAAVALRDDYAAGYRAIRRILALGEARGYEPDTSHARFEFALLVCWFEPIENGVQAAQRAREGLIAGGELAYAGYTYQTAVQYLVDCTPSLDSFVAEAEAGLAFVRRTGSEQTGQWLENHRWLAGVLRGESSAAPGEAVPIDRYADNPLALCFAHIDHAIAAAIFGDPDALGRHTAAAMPLLPAVPGNYPTAVARLLRGLALAGQARAADDGERGALLSELDEVTRWMAARAADAPDNFLHLVRLLEGERAWSVGNFRGAVLAFDAARREVAQRQRPWHQALIAERTAHFYLAHAVDQAGYDLLAQARQNYLAWGATAKVGQLDWAYPTVRALADATTGDGGDQPGDRAHRGSAVTTGTIDLLGIVSASRALSSQISIDRLRARVKEVLSAMTGATGVHLLLWDDDRHAWLRPTSGGGGAVAVSGGGRQDEVPMSVLRYTQRMGGTLVVGDATRDDRFARDPYFADVDCCSLLALPILSRGTLQAMLLLENRLIRNAFSTERLDAVQLIASQLAVSLDNAQLYTEYRRIADEQAALRRVATLVARGIGPDLVFATVADELGALIGADTAAILRFEPDGDVTVMGGYGFEDPQPGTRAKADLHSALASVQATGVAARRDADDPSASPPQTLRSAVASPIVVEGRVWGAMSVGSRRDRLPQDTEQRLAEFTELAATAIANAESRAELATSRARIVAAADHTRQRIERDLHDGAQQRLVSLALLLRAAQAAAPPDLGALVTDLDYAVAEATGALDELREIARGVHPGILAEGGLRPALEILANRSPVPVDLALRAEGRLPEHVEVSAYYVVAEALTNVAKHARASTVTVTVKTDAADAVLRLAVRDDGAGGATFTRGTGLVGLKDRVEALGGRIFLDSPRGGGTSLRAELPLTAMNGGITSR